MQLQTIAEHTVDTSLLSGGICIDAGCLGFQFSEAMAELGCKVYAFDIQSMIPPVNRNIKFLRRAVGTFMGTVKYTTTNDPQAAHVSIEGEEVAVIDLFGGDWGTDGWDLLKLDIEGSEYTILLDERLSKPVGHFNWLPKQISCEFHEHCQPIAHSLYFDKCIANLSVNYIPVQHERTSQHGAGFNYWDSLFIRKDLL